MASILENLSLLLASVSIILWDYDSTFRRHHYSRLKKQIWRSNLIVHETPGGSPTPHTSHTHTTHLQSPTTYSNMTETDEGSPSPLKDLLTYILETILGQSNGLMLHRALVTNAILNAADLLSLPLEELPQLNAPEKWEDVKKKHSEGKKQPQGQVLPPGLANLLHLFRVYIAKEFANSFFDSSVFQNWQHLSAASFNTFHMTHSLQPPTVTSSTTNTAASRSRHSNSNNTGSQSTNIQPNRHQKLDYSQFSDLKHSKDWPVWNIEFCALTGIR